ncbi:hypothetical protein MRX96_016127 [Rhipicephalus microplus]
MQRRRLAVWSGAFLALIKAAVVAPGEPRVARVRERRRQGVKNSGSFPHCLNCFSNVTRSLTDAHNEPTESSRPRICTRRVPRSAEASLAFLVRTKQLRQRDASLFSHGPCESRDQANAA